MKKLFLTFMVLIMIFCFFGCSAPSTDTGVSTTSKYENSQFVGKWYNTFSDSDTPDFEIKSDGTVIYKGDTNGTWDEKNDELIISLILDGKPTTMNGYFVISGDGFVARATDENRHYLDEGKGELQLEIMLTEKTCVDCVKK
jgi:hypothetical protein